MSFAANIHLKNLAYTAIIAFILEGCESEARANVAESYFPLNVGNSWTYRNRNGTKELTFKIIGTEQIDGRTYYKFDDYFNIFPPPPDAEDITVTVGRNVLFRYDQTRDVVLMRWGKRDITRYDFGGGNWDPGSGFGWSRLKQKGVNCKVAVGNFSNCFNFQFGRVYCGPGIDEPDAYAFGEYLAPGAGNVKYVVPGGNFLGLSEGKSLNFELQNCVIVIGSPCENQPYPVGDLNYDCRVDLLDLAILASHWLEDHTPKGTTTYQFLPEQSTMVWHVGRAGWSIPHSIEGQFKLMVDFDAAIARFEQVDAILANGQPPPTRPGLNLNGRRLDDCFHITELISKYVSHTSIYFEGHFDSGSPSDRLVVIELTLMDNLVHLVGREEYAEVIADRDAYSLDAVAIKVREP